MVNGQHNQFLFSTPRVMVVGHKEGDTQRKLLKRNYSEANRRYVYKVQINRNPNTKAQKKRSEGYRQVSDNSKSSRSRLATLTWQERVARNFC